MLKKMIILTATLLNLSALQAEKVCESCILRQQSHKDDLNAVRYYEDSQYFNSNLRDNKKENEAVSDAYQKYQFPPEKQESTGPYSVEEVK